MDVREFMKLIHLAERLKDTPRHCYTSGGRRESVAEHCWRISLMSLFLRDEFPQADIDRVIRMCIVHDLGEMFTGDIPVFNKTAADEEKEEALLFDWVDSLPAPYPAELRSLFEEMNALQTTEAKLYKAMDSLEALIQHNESDLSTWAPNEYDLQRTYAHDRVAFSDYLKSLRALILEESEAKIAENGVNE